jgi:hypothetical protein
MSKQNMTSNFIPLYVQWQIFHEYSGRESVQQYKNTPWTVFALIFFSYLPESQI